MKYTRRAGAALAITAALGILISIGGCSSSGGSGAALSSAKKSTLDLETQIAAFVPADMVTSTQQTKSSKVIYSCLGHSDTSQWPGTETVSLKSGVDSDGIMTAIASNWTNKSGWTVFQSTGADGSKALNIKSDKGANYKVAIVDGPQLTITALSACFANAGLSGRSSY